MRRKGRRILAKIRRWHREASGWERPYTKQEIYERLMYEEPDPNELLKDFQKNKNAS